MLKHVSLYFAPTSSPDVGQCVLGRLGVALEELTCTRVHIAQKGNEDGGLGTRVPPLKMALVDAGGSGCIVQAAKGRPV